MSVGFLNAHHHTPKIVIYKLIDNERREVARFSDEDLKRTLTVSVVGMNDLSTKPSLYQVLDGEQTDERDFRWTVDVERDLYKRKLKIKDNFFGKIHFQTGLFYSSKLSQEVLKFVSVDSSQTLPFFRQIGRPAAAVDLTIDQEVVITGLSQSVRLSAQNNTNYLVSVSNLPPEDMMNMDHFGFYYSVIDEELVRYLPVA
ncbi:MAG: hypothetical protein JNN15_21545, partial [Blastocatellia bacterium]|nr:hypothetical protein [Blastocatellia bacterium]